MNTFEETMANCRRYLSTNANVKMAFENQESSSCPGFEYTLKDGTHIKLRIDNGIGYATIEAYPGITVHDAHQSFLVCEYCQQVTKVPAIGYLALEPDKASIYYHTESCFKDSPISENVFKLMEEAATQTLKKHRPILDCLAYGRLPDRDTILSAMTPTEEVTVPVMREQTIDRICQYLKNSDSYTVAQNLNSNDPGQFFMEIDNEYRGLVYLLQDGWLACTVRMDFQCKSEHRSQVAWYCNDISNSKKVGFLTVADDGYPYYTVVNNILGREETLTEETFEKMGDLATTVLDHCDKLRYIGHGVTPPDSKNDILIEAMLRGARARQKGSGNALHYCGSDFGQLDLACEGEMDMPDTGMFQNIGEVIKAATCSDSVAQSILKRNFGDVFAEESDDDLSTEPVEAEPEQDATAE